MYQIIETFIYRETGKFVIYILLFKRVDTLKMSSVEIIIINLEK